MKLLPKLACLAAFILTGCGSSQVTNVYHAASIPVPSSGKALVVIYRESQLGGAAIPFHISQDGGKLGTLWTGQYLRREISPGRHGFSASFSEAETKTWTLEVGQSYFLRVGSHAKPVSFYQPHLTLVDPQEGASSLLRLKQVPASTN